MLETIQSTDPFNPSHRNLSWHQGPGSLEESRRERAWLIDVVGSRGYSAGCTIRADGVDVGMKAVRSEARLLDT